MRVFRAIESVNYMLNMIDTNYAYCFDYTILPKLAYLQTQI